MANFKALPSESQSGDDVLYFDTEAAPTELLECAQLRISTARRMLAVMGALRSVDDPEALPAVASAAAMLMSDAEGMLFAMYDVIRSHEKLVEAVAAVEADMRH